MKKADLHIHSTVSDGLLTPEEAVGEAARLNLAAIALTDHDTLDGISRGAAVAEDKAVKLIPGVELTVDFNGRECHLLAYHFKPDAPNIIQLIKHNKKARLKRAGWIIRQLQQQGLSLDLDEVRAEANGFNVGRPHIANILRKKGYVNSVRAAFVRYLSDKALGPIKNSYRTYRQVINQVKCAGGVMVLAHPGRLYSKAECEQFASAGIDGVELLHPSHTFAMQKQIKAFAQKHHLLMTGGSDYHGAKKDYYSHFGTIAISEQHIEKLNALARKREKVSA